VLRGALIWLDSALAFPSPSDEWHSAREASWGLLTASEYNVARHVARGLTNRETAALLCVSPHTVDYHLRQIFRKLQIRSRVELARLEATRAC
jgi:DNA-binding CsgD family transcriptional regulator